MLPPETLICLAGSGLGAGPATTSPVVMLYWLPWHGQSMVPSLIWLTIHPIWVQTALNALKSPAVGWVTTTCDSVKISPLPTGIWLVAASALTPVLLLDPPAPQAVIAPARPTRPTPASTPRRVASKSVRGSCVTTAPVRVCGCLPSLYRNGPHRRAVHAKFTASAPDTVAECNEQGGRGDSQERDFGHAERVLASNNGNELDKWGLCGYFATHFLLVRHIHMSLRRVSISIRSAIILAVQASRMGNGQMLRVSTVEGWLNRPRGTEPVRHDLHAQGVRVQDHCVIIRSRGEDSRRSVGEPGVSGPAAGAQALRLHLVMVPPGTRGGPHFPPGGETAIYMVSGEAAVWHGAALAKQSTVRAGDFVHIPQGTPHLAVNRSEVTSIAVAASTDPADQAGAVVIELPGHLTDLLGYPVAVGE